MTNEDKQREKLWSYLDEELDAEASQAFENALFEDNQLRNDLVERKVFNRRMAQLTQETHLSDEEMARITQAAWEPDMGIQPEEDVASPNMTPWIGMLSLAAALIIAFVSYNLLVDTDPIRWAAPQIATLRDGGDADTYKSWETDLKALCAQWQEETTEAYRERGGEKAPAWKLNMAISEVGEERLEVIITGNIVGSTKIILQALQGRDVWAGFARRIKTAEEFGGITHFFKGQAHIVALFEREVFKITT